VKLKSRRQQFGCAPDRPWTALQHTSSGYPSMSTPGREHIRSRLPLCQLESRSSCECRVSTARTSALTRI
jgi:hypothetical protein